MEWRYTVSQYYCSMLQSRSKRCEEIAIERTLQASDNVISANEHSGRVVLGTSLAVSLDVIDCVIDVP